MIKTALTHAAMAVAIQLSLALYLQWLHGFNFEQGMLAGGIAACFGFFFREVSQHETKGGGAKVVSMTYGLTNHWTLDSVLDIVFPIIATGALWLLM